MTETQKKVEKLESMLTGDMEKDMEIMEKLYELRKPLRKELEEGRITCDDDDGFCEMCGS